jgi:hypothetical protein
MRFPFGDIRLVSFFFHSSGVGLIGVALLSDKGHYHLLPCLSGRALCERSLGPYRVNLRRGVSRVRSGQRHKLGIFFMT